MEGFDARVAEWTGRRNGILTMADVCRLDGSSDMARSRVASGRWERVSRGVYRVAGHPPTWESSVAAAVASGGPTAVASHRTAAHLWRIDGFARSRPEISVHRHHRRLRVAGIVHESTDLELADLTEVHGVPVTGFERTLLDLGAVVPWTRVEEAIDDSLRRGRTDWPELYATLVRHSRRGRDGCGRLRAVLDERYGDQVVPDSRFERFVTRLLRDAGLPAPALQHEVTDDEGITWRLDLAYPARRVAIELQSKAHHLNVAAFERDKRKLNALRLLGWTVLEFTWQLYLDKPETLRRQVRAALQLDPQRAVLA